VRGFAVTVNGTAQDIQATPGSYLGLSRTWAPGDTVDVSMPFSIRIERAIDRPDTQSIFWGPVLMPILGNPGGGAFRQLTLYQYLKLDGDYSRAAITPAGTSPAGDGLPNYNVPVTGITSPGHDGLTFLDVVWDQAPFPTHGQFVSTVTHAGADFAARGLFTSAQEDAVVSAAATARATGALTRAAQP
jgi:uncharacterized protein